MRAKPNDAVLIMVVAAGLGLLTAAIKPLPGPTLRPVGQDEVISLPGAAPGVTTTMGTVPVCAVCGARATWTTAAPGRAVSGKEFWCDLHKPVQNSTELFLKSAGLYLLGYMILLALMRRVFIGRF